MMIQWMQKPLGELTDFMSKGIAPKYTDTESANTVRVLNQKCNRNFEISYGVSRLHDCTKKKVPDVRVLRIGDVLINSTGTGTAGRVAQVRELPGPTTLDGHMILLRPTDEIDPIYYGYALKLYQKQIEGLAEGSTGQTEINRDRLKNEIVITYPEDKVVQKRIADVLRALDEKIAVNEEINKNLEQQASEIYKAWFENFLPFRGECPTTWRRGTLSDIAHVSSGKRPLNKSKMKTSKMTIPLVGAADVMGFTDRANHTDKILVTGRVGTHGIIQRFNSPCWTSDNTLVITSDYYEYMYQVLRRIDFHAMNRGSTQPLITQSDLNNVSVSIPDQETLKSFESIIGGLMSEYTSNIEMNNTLATIRDTLLPKLLSGELDVSRLSSVV